MKSLLKLCPSGVLFCLESFKPLCQSEIAKKLNMSYINVSKVIRLLDKKGFVIYTNDKRDIRKNIVQLTPKGKEVVLLLKKIDLFVTTTI